VAGDRDNQGVEPASDNAAGAAEQGALGEATASRMGAAALLLAGSIALSRVIGYFREVALAHQVGVGSETDAFYTAFLIPDMLNYLMAGGALAIAFIPLYNRVRRRDGEAAGDELLATVLGTLGVVTIVATLLLWQTAPQIIAAGFPKFSPEAQALTVKLTRIVLPAQIFFLTGGLLRAVLMAHGRFGAQALAPLVYNGAIIAGGLATGTVEGFAWGVLVGAFVGNWLIPIVQIVKVRSLRVRFAPFDAHFRAYLVLALPLMLGASLLTVDEWYEKIFGAQLAVGTVAQLGFARRLMMAPVSVVGQAVAAAALPLLSRYYSERREDELNETLGRTLIHSLGLGSLVAGGFYVFATPLVEALYQYGSFGEEDSLAVGALLCVLSLAVPGWVAQQIAVRAFYAREQMWRPMLLGTAVALLAMPLYIALGKEHGAAGLAWAGVLAISANAIATLVWSRLRFGGPALGEVGEGFLRSGCVALAAAVAASYAAPLVPESLGVWGVLVIGGGVYAAVALGLGWAVGEAAVVGVILPRVLRRASPDTSDDTPKSEA
jgi:putative peptidoglycan lipid II flippase